MTTAIVVLVIAARFVVPLAIPKFPLPAIVAAMVLDAADQSIFSAFGAELANYQSYDKALDVFYLTIAYISTIRNWTDGVPFRTGQGSCGTTASSASSRLSSAKSSVFLLLIFPTRSSTSSSTTRSFACVGSRVESVDGTC